MKINLCYVREKTTSPPSCDSIICYLFPFSWSRYRWTCEEEIVVVANEIFKDLMSFFSFF
jgi:hypothetical protein